MVEQIKKLRQEGKSYKEIHEALGCSKSTISYHLNSNTHKRQILAQRKRRRNIVKELKIQHGGQCVTCGYNKCMAALHFHHTNPLTKLMEISDAISNGTIQQAKDEAEKCILICANCHAELHEKERLNE